MRERVRGVYGGQGETDKMEDQGGKEDEGGFIESKAARSSTGYLAYTSSTCKYTKFSGIAFPGILL